MTTDGRLDGVTVTARAVYHPLPDTPDLRLGLALTNLFLPLGDAITPHARDTFAVGGSFPVTLTAFEGEPHPFRWAGHEIHSRHRRIRTCDVDVIALAENGLEVPRWACRALPGLEDWAEDAPVGAYWGFPAGDPRADVCRYGYLNGWTVHLQAPSTGTFELPLRWCAGGATRPIQAPEQLGSVTVHVTIH